MLGIEPAFHCEAHFRLGEAKEAGAVLELEQSALDGFSVHGIQVRQNRGSSI